MHEESYFSSLGFKNVQKIPSIYENNSDTELSAKKTIVQSGTNENVTPSLQTKEDFEIRNAQGQQGHQNNVKLLICMDSNQKFLDHRKLWTLEGTKWIKCSKIESVRQAIQKESSNKVEAILISCGVNDLDEKSGKEVADEILATIYDAKEKYKNVKIILSEPTQEMTTETMKFKYVIELSIIVPVFWITYTLLTTRIFETILGQNIMM